MKEKYLKAFREEAFELCDELENSLMKLESDISNSELINACFRALHTLKGSSGMFGYENISMFVHKIENVFELIRKGKLEINSNIIDKALKATDIVRLMLENKQFSEEQNEKFTIVVKQFAEILKERENLTKLDQESKIETFVKKETQKKVYYIYFEPNDQIFLSGYNPFLILKELAFLGELISHANLEKIPNLNSFEFEKCYLSWKMLLISPKIIEDIRDVFIFVEGNSKIKIEKIADETKFELTLETRDYLLKLLREKDEINAEDLNFAGSFYYDEIIPEKKSEEADYKEETRFRKSDKESTIRVASEKLDEFVNLIGELITSHSKIYEFALRQKSEELISLTEEMERIAWNLRDSAFKVRMLPLEPTFNSFKRYARDLARELKKEVIFETYGGDTELDKSVIDKISEPLSHLLRNALDHGIESPEERLSKGKNKIGKISLSAYYSGSNVLIEFSDDGRGLHKEKILSKAVELGIFLKNKDYSDSDIFSLIFHPGFSTADKVSNLSGRGVGLDVVKKFIDNIRGDIFVKSEKDRGTTFILKIPLTLAIIHGLLISSAGSVYIIPIASVSECMEFININDEIRSQKTISYRGKAFPYVKLRKIFGEEDFQNRIQYLIVVSENDISYGIVCDKILGERQVVVKSLNKFYSNAKHISGMAILGDGTIGLILDIKAIYQEILSQEQKDEK